jgi:hypothetical protein
MRSFTVWGAVCILVGLGFLASALRIYLRRKRFLAAAQRAVGTVVDVRVSGVGRNRVSFPVFEFRTPEGTVRRSESLMGSGFGGFKVGETVAVRYDPSDPARAEVDTFAVLWGLTILRAGFAFIFLLMGTIAIVV